MLRIASLALITTLFALPSELKAQAPEASTPTKEHQWLEKFAGDWTSTGETTVGPDQPAVECEGEMSSRMIGGLWVINEISGDMGGVTMTGIQTIGYDPERKKYVGTWVDSMINHLWQYEGQVDKEGKRLVLEAKGPNFLGDGKMLNYRDSYEFQTPDTILTVSQLQDDQGKWVTFMSGQLRRK